MKREIHDKLLAPFSDSDLEWRLQRSFDNDTGIAVPYVTNRGIQKRLDDVVGFDNWKNEYIPWHNDGPKASQICGISIYDEDRNNWLTKYDGAEDSDIEPVKGGLSDSMKRAGVQWGIGRYLYSMGTVWVKTEKKGKSTFIADSEKAKLNQLHQQLVQRLFGDKSGSQQQPTPQTDTIPHTGPREIPKANAPASTPTDAAWVVGIATVPTVNGTPNTNLQLKNANGKTIEVFCKGTDAALAVGTMLINTKFSTVENQGVIFHILEKYDIAAQSAA